MRNIIKLVLINIVITSVLLVADYSEAGMLLDKNSLKYLGAFKVPDKQMGCTNWDACVFSYGGGPVAFYQAGNGGSGSLFMGGNAQYNQIAEISIPKLVNSSNINDLNTAIDLQNFYDISEGNRNNILTGGAPYSGTVNNGGLLVWGNRLIGTVYTYYPGETQILSHYTSGLNLSTTGDFSGMFQLAGAGARMVGGYMCKIPTEWQSAFGGPALTGQAALSIISTTSSGPSASVFDPAQLGVVKPVPTIPLVYYPINHPLANPQTQNNDFTVTSTIKGIVFPSGTDSILFFGRNGTGAYCYGEQDLDPQSLCYDPVSSSKGPHMYPYRYQIWAYSATELLSVKNGTKNPWDAKPYAVWNFDLPFNRGDSDLQGITFDEATGKLYVSQGYGQIGQFDAKPVVHVFEITKNSTTSPNIINIKSNP